MSLAADAPTDLFARTFVVKGADRRSAALAQLAEGLENQVSLSETAADVTAG